MPDLNEEPTGKAEAVDQGQRSQRLREDVGATILHATDVLERELSRNLTGARELQQKILRDHRMSSEDFTALIDRFRTTTHTLIDAAADGLAPRSETSQELVGRFTDDAHNVADALVDLIGTTPLVLNRFTEFIKDLDRRERTDPASAHDSEPQDSQDSGRSPQ